jgi:Ca2+-binding EF-hand superfamily protein
MLFDKDKSGFIEAREIREVTSTLGMPLSRDELEDFMKMADQVSIS